MYKFSRVFYELVCIRENKNWSENEAHYLFAQIKISHSLGLHTKLARTPAWDCASFAGITVVSRVRVRDVQTTHRLLHLYHSLAQTDKVTICIVRTMTAIDTV